MAKELYIYSPLYDFTAETVVKQLNEVEENEDLTIRLNTQGGNVDAGWSIISKMSERKAPINAVIDGNAQSMGAIMLVFFDKVVANDTSMIMFHKAGYPSYYEATEAEKEGLKIINAQFKDKLKAKVNGNDGAKEFLAKVFEADVRNDVTLTAKEAKKLGIVSEVRKLTPTAYDLGMQVVAMFEDPKEKPKATNTPESGANNKSKNSKKMKKEEFKLANPTAYAEIVDEGASAELDRVEAWAVFYEVSPEKVKAGISSGKPLSMKAMAEFNLQAQQGKKVTAMQEENVPEVIVPAEKVTKEAAKAEAQAKAFDEEFMGGAE